MNTHKGKMKFKGFRILLDNRCSYTLETRRLITILKPEEEAMIQWNTQVGNITTDLRIKIDLTLPNFSATKIVMWNCHVDNSAKVRYYMILGRYLLTALGSNPNFSENLIKAENETLKVSSAPMVDLGTYEFIYVNTGIITPK